MSWTIPDGTRLDELVRDWLDDMQGQIDADTTAELYRLHWATHLAPFFGQAQAINSQAISAYCRARLKKVKRRTVQKERSTLSSFLAWCLERGYIDAELALPPLPKRAPGTPWHQPRRGAATELSPEECACLIARLPMWSTPRGGREAFPVRPRFVVAYETSLRPATLDALSCPEHWSRGETMLRITDEIDKARFGRMLPLSAAAQSALESVARRGLIFGEHDYRWQLDKAAKAVLPAAKAKTFCSYDFRHARLTHLAETGNLPGVAYHAGHKRVTTTALYVRPGLRAAQRTLAHVDCPTVEVLAPARVWGFESPPSHSPALLGTSPSPASNRELPAAEGLAGVATALLEAAASGEDLDTEHLRAFARAALESTEIGRLALGVLDGGQHAPRRALELAQLLASAAAAGAARREGGS